MYIGNVWTEGKVQNWFSVIKFIIFLSLSKKKDLGSFTNCWYKSFVNYTKKLKKQYRWVG